MAAFYLYMALVTGFGCWAAGVGDSKGWVEFFSNLIIGLVWPVYLPSMLVKAIIVAGGKR